MSRAVPLRADEVELEFGAPIAVGRASKEDVIRYAALAAAPDGDQSMDRALRTHAEHRGVDLPAMRRIGRTRVDPQRGYALTTLEDDAEGTVEIARGTPEAVLDALIASGPGTGWRARTIRARLGVGSYEPLAVAVRTGGGPWRLLGYLPVRVWSLREPGEQRPFDYHLVWDLWLRISHWVWVAAIVVLTVTGYFIADPGWVPTAWIADSRAGYFFGSVRWIHYTAAVVFMLVLVVRAWNLSTSRIHFDRWQALIPFRNRHEAANLLRTLRAYLFIGTRTAPEYLGHNPLQQLTYTLIYVVFLAQVFTGLAMWGLYDSQSSFWAVFHWLNVQIGAQNTRMLHFAIMWVIILFLPLHVYLSIRADSVERSGAISSMVSGGRWVRRGAVFEDWPKDAGKAGR